MKEHTQYIIDKIEASSDSSKAGWLENYVKHDIKSLGVGIPVIRNIVISAEEKFGIAKRSFKDQKEMLDYLMSLDFTELKLAAVLYIQLYMIESDPGKILRVIFVWFDKKLIYDWNVCDWLCVSILSPLLDKYPRITVPELTVWNCSENLWKARASLVPFAQCKNIVKYKKKYMNCQ